MPFELVILNASAVPLAENIKSLLTVAIVAVVELVVSPKISCDNVEAAPI